MKVIKKQDTSIWTHKYICETCDSELEIEVQDIHYRGDFRNPGFDDYWVTCLVCSAETSLSRDELPKLVQLQAQKRVQNSDSQRDR